MHWRRKWQPTPVFLPRESQGRGSLAGCRLWGLTELDMTEATQQQQQDLGLHRRWTSVQFSCSVQLFATPWTVAYQALWSMGFSRQEYWSGLPFPSPGDLPNQGIETGSPALQTLCRLSHQGIYDVQHKKDEYLRRYIVNEK